MTVPQRIRKSLKSVLKGEVRSSLDYQ